ncbi:MAG: hypothetical protein ACXWC4_22305 [Telluria sp.]
MSLIYSGLHLDQACTPPGELMTSVTAVACIATQSDNTRFVGVRWDFRKNMDLKLQHSDKECGRLQGSRHRAWLPVCKISA